MLAAGRARGFPTLVPAASLPSRRYDHHAGINARHHREKRGTWTALQRCWSMGNNVEEDPFAEFCPVPVDQQPINELKELQV